MKGLTLIPLTSPPELTAWVPGSKSHTNRALFCAAAAAETSVLDGVLFADDTEAMLGALADLGVGLDIDRDAYRVTVRGLSGAPTGSADLTATISGTTSRFLLPFLAAGHGTFTLTGGAPLLVRPFADQIVGLRSLGAEITCNGEPGHLPVTVDATGLVGGHVELRADTSSQFASGLLLSAPLLREGLTVHLTTEPVSRPYLELTVNVMRQFGAVVETPDDLTYVVQPGGYQATDVMIEPDASAASYFMAAAAVTGGRIRIDGLSRSSQQGDVLFADALDAMGAQVTWGDNHIEVTGGPLHGIDLDMRHISDTAQTLACVAAFADGPTTIRGIGFIRKKETDRIAAMVTELQRCGVSAAEDDDGFTVWPGSSLASRQPIHGASIRTYDDHRMAMSFALLGLRIPGIEILDPGCVAKTFPTFFDEWAGLALPAR
ncbi:MAG: 3-phosphoshikimate 1-carboxyvinyltransferase [Candidatus Poriferisodalaceae bacterium]|jgi:3-phosphoshikimate 1-carboxyvinyltransferase